MRAQVAELQAWGYPSRLIDADELASAGARAGAASLHGGVLLTPRRPCRRRAVVRACLESSEGRGATVREHAGPVSLRKCSDGVATVDRLPA